MANHASISAKRFSISRKVAAFFLLLALMAGGYQLAVYRAQQRLDGIAEDINAAGRLRYLSQQIHATVLSAALTQSWGNGTANLIDEFADRLGELERRGAVIGQQNGPSIGSVLPLLEQVRSAWSIYRQDVQSFLKAQPAREASLAQLARIGEEANQVLVLADQATTLLAERAETVKQQILTILSWLTLFNLAVLLAVFIIVRRQIVRPLRRLADASLHFADGNYGARTGFRSHDDIGLVSEAFDHMAEETQQHIEAIAADLKEIRQQQADLKKLSSAVENSPAAVVITDADAIIQYVNPAFTEATGYSFAEAVGQTPRVLKSGRTPLKTYQDMWQTILAGGIWSGELMNRKKSGELIWENTRISSVRNERGEITHFVAIKEDVTKRKRAEEDLLFLNLNLEKRVVERTRQLEDAYVEQEAFSYSVSHDLRAPLRSINGFAHAMAEDCAGCAKTESLDHLQRVQVAAIRMGQLIDDLLSLGDVGKAELHFKTINLSEMVRTILQGLSEHEPGRRATLEVMDDIHVTGDPRMLRIALENLLGNAWKYTARCEETYIAFGETEEDGERAVFVRDNGAGFSMVYAEKLFKPFQRLHSPSDFKGSGIGLAIVQRIISRHGGRIWAQAEKDKGATFYFSLPDADADAE